MNGCHITCVWIMFCSVYMVILTAMYMIIPREIVIIWIEEIFGDEGITFAEDFFIYGTAIINFLLIWLVVAVCLLSYQKSLRSDEK